MIGLAKYKAVLVAAALVGSAGAGWLAQGWRMGKRIEAQRADYAEAKGRRGQAYADTLAQASLAATARITEAQAILSQARAIKAKALAETAAKAPTAPQFACRETPLPETYLETYRK